LWFAFLACLLAVYAGSNWIPSVLTGAGLTITLANTGLSAFNLGGVIGALGGALTIRRFGSKRTMLIMTGAGVIAAIIMSVMKINQDSAATPVILMLGITGGLINGIQTTMYALAAHIYPSTVRVTGVGTASSVGRIGAILSPYVGNWALDAGGASGFFGVLASAMLVVLVSLALIRRHIPEIVRGAAL